MGKIFKIISVAIMVLLVLQTAFLCVICIQNSDSKAFRLAVGFIGLGLIITPLTLQTLGRVAGEESPAGAWLGLFFLLYMLAGPWIQLMNRGDRFVSGFNYLATASASIQLASSTMGFFITGMITAIAPPAYDGTGLEPVPWVRVLRAVLSLMLLWFAGYSIMPVLSQIHPFFMKYNPFSMAPGSYGLIVAYSSGSPYKWLLNFAFGVYAYFRFYSAWIIKKEIA